MVQAQVADIANFTIASLRKQGIFLSQEWVTQAINHVLQTCGPCPNPVLLDHVYKLFILSDYRCSHDEKSHQLDLSDASTHDNTLKQPTVFQIDEISNVGASYVQKSLPSSSRFLKFCLSCGSQQIVGLELAPITGITVDSSPGLKISIRGAPLRRGGMLLLPTFVKVLGGEVEQLALIKATRQVQLTDAIQANSFSTTAITTSSTLTATHTDPIHIQKETNSNATLGTKNVSQQPLTKTTGSARATTIAGNADASASTKLPRYAAHNTTLSTSKPAINNSISHTNDISVLNALINNDSNGCKSAQSFVYDQQSVHSTNTTICHNECTSNLERVTSERLQTSLFAQVIGPENISPNNILNRAETTKYELNQSQSGIDQFANHMSTYTNTSRASFAIDLTNSQTMEIEATDFFLGNHSVQNNSFQSVSKNMTANAAIEENFSTALYHDSVTVVTAKRSKKASDLFITVAHDIYEDDIEINAEDFMQCNDGNNGTICAKEIGNMTQKDSLSPLVQETTSAHTFAAFRAHTSSSSQISLLEVTTLEVNKFTVKDNCFKVWLHMCDVQEQEIVLVQVRHDFVTEYLNLSTKEYNKIVKQKGLTSDEKKQKKYALMSRFDKLKGVFLARQVPSSNESVMMTFDDEFEDTEEQMPQIELLNYHIQ